MAVYTKLSDNALRQFLKTFRVGDLISAKGVSAGTINTIYDIQTTTGRYILRILENRKFVDAQFEASLLQQLAKAGLTVPKMMEAGKLGAVVPFGPRQQLSIFQFLPGRDMGVFEVAPDHVRQVGQFLASMHQVTARLTMRRRNRFAPERIRHILSLCLAAPAKNAEQREHLKILKKQVEVFEFNRALPRAVVHGDLFIDNVRFNCGKLCGVIDFEMASSGPLIYDLAVAICDWGFLHDRFMPERTKALLRGYQSKRALRDVEKSALYDTVCFAAARFAITRFHDFELNTQPDVQRMYKDYRHFFSRLQSLLHLGREKFADIVAKAQAKPVTSPSRSSKSPLRVSVPRDRSL
jgi:homoserine kinase type II